MVTDPFTLDVIAASLDAAATEMFEVLRKTAISPIIYEVIEAGDTVHIRTACGGGSE